MSRKIEFTDNVIDVDAVGKIIERHIAKRLKLIVDIIVHQPVPMEGIALYQ